MKIDGLDIAFIGTGVMGSSMAGHLLRAGAKLRVYTRTKTKAEGLIKNGAVWADTPALAASGARVVFTMVGYPADVEEVYLGKAGILAAAPEHCIVVDHTTSDPALAKRIAEKALAAGKAALDAPVSGGDSGARNAALSIMVGGDKAAFDEVKPLLDIMGKTIILQGGPGAGQHTKMANQISVAASLMGAVESMIYAEKSGLDPLRVLESIGGGAAQSWQLTGMAPKMLAGDFEPGFYSKHFLKDLRIALNAAKTMGLTTPLLALAENLFTTMQIKGFGEKGTQALYKLYKEGFV